MSLNISITIGDGTELGLSTYGGIVDVAFWILLPSKLLHYNTELWYCTEYTLFRILQKKHQPTLVYFISGFLLGSGMAAVDNAAVLFLNAFKTLRDLPILKRAIFS